MNHRGKNCRNHEYQDSNDSASTPENTGIRNIMRLYELSFKMCLEPRTTNGSSSGHIMRLVPAFILETNNQNNYKMFAQVRPDG